MKKGIYLGLFILFMTIASAEYYIDIQADYINVSKVTVTDVDITRLAYNVWRLNSTNANYAIQRAKVIQQLYGDTFLLNNSDVSALYVSNSSDVGRTGIYSYQYMSVNCNFISTAKGINTINLENPSTCSMWGSNGATIFVVDGGTATATASFYKDSTLLTQASVSSGAGYITQSVNEWGTDTSADDASGINQFNVSTYFNRISADGNYQGNQNSKAIMFCDSNSSSIVRTETSSGCSFTRQRLSIDYHNDYLIPFTSLSENLSIAFFGIDPINGSGINQTTELSYRLNNVDTSVDCNITDNGVGVEYLTGLTNGSYSFSFNTTYWATGWNNLNITCNDSSNSISDIKSLYVDKIQPEILYINVTQSGVSTNLSNNYLETNVANFTASTNDTNNYFFSINITHNTTGVQYLYFQNTSITETYVYNNETDMASWPSGTYKVLVTAKDAHTKNKIDIKSEKFAYNGMKGAKFDDSVQTYISESEIIDFNLIKKQDREMFEVKFKPNVNRFTISVEGKNSVEYLGDKYGYQGHFIIDGKYWYDLENKQGAKIKKVTKVSDTKYIVEMTKDITTGTVLFESVGIINVNTETRYFNIILLNVTVRDESTNECLTGVTTIFTSDSTAFNTTINCSALVSWPNLDDFTIRYYADDYPTRTRVYEFDGTSEPKITLYLANYTTSQDISFAVVDQYENRVPNSIITVYKYILDDSAFQPIIDLITNVNGEASTTLIPSTELYRYMVTFDGAVVWNNSNVNGEPIYPGDTSFTFKVYIGEDIYEIADILDTIVGDVTSYYNQTTNNTGYFRFAFTSEESRQLCLLITNVTDDASMSVQCLTGTSGLISYYYNLTSTKVLLGRGVLNYGGKYYLIDSETIKVEVDRTISPFDTSESYEAWFIAVFGILLVAIGLASHPEMSVIGAGVTLIALILTKIIYLQPWIMYPAIITVAFLTILIAGLVYQGGKK